MLMHASVVSITRETHTHIPEIYDDDNCGPKRNNVDFVSILPL